MELNSAGEHFYYQGNYVGKIGTNYYKGYSNLRGLNFDLENAGAYMSWSYQESADADTYSMKLVYAAKNIGNLAADRLHALCTLDLNNNSIYNANLNNWSFQGGSISATWSGYYVTSFNSDGTASTWKSFKLVFKNGILQSAEW